MYRIKVSEHDSIVNDNYSEEILESGVYTKISDSIEEWLYDDGDGGEYKIVCKHIDEHTKEWAYVGLYYDDDDDDRDEDYLYRLIQDNDGWWYKSIDDLTDYYVDIILEFNSDKQEYYLDICGYRKYLGIPKNKDDDSEYTEINECERYQYIDYEYMFGNNKHDYGDILN